MSTAKSQELVETLRPGFMRCALRTPTLPPATHTNCWMVGFEDIIVFEPASPYPEEQARLDAALDALVAEGRRIRGIFLTHHHGDHVGGVPHLAARLGVPVHAHQRTAELLSGVLPAERWHWVEDNHLELLRSTNGDEIRLRAVFTPGHAPGHLVFFDEVSGVMIAGDMVAGLGFIVIDPDSEGDMTLYLASLRHMRELKPTMLLPAHGPAIGSGDPVDPAAVAKLDEYIRHRLAREEKVHAALAAAGGPATREDLLRVVYADVDPAMHFVADRSLAAHLEKLVLEGRAARVSGHGIQQRYLATWPPA